MARIGTAFGCAAGVGLVAALLLISCAGAPTASKTRASAVRPESVRFQGTLVPVDDLSPALIAGKTVVMVQPWVGAKGYEFRKTPIYFRADGYADSPLWVDVPWSVADGQLCMVSGTVDSCYDAFEDDTGQAYLQHAETNLLAQVKSIQRGDPYRVREAYEDRQRQQEAQQAMALAFIGALGEAMMSGGGGGGSTYDYYPGSSSSSAGGYSGSSSTPPIGGATGLYGDCHGVGC